MRGISKDGKVYECMCKPKCCEAWCTYSTYDFLWKLGKVVCNKSDENCKWRKEIKNIDQKIKKFQGV